MKPVSFATIDEINASNDFDHFKFVKVSGKYRFASTSANWMVNHTDMIKESELNNVEGAGTIEIANGKWKISDRHSSTLKHAGAKNFILTDIMENELNQMVKHEYDACL